MRIIAACQELDAEWLAGALGTGPVASFSSEQIGTGQMSETHRIALAYEDAERAGPASVVLKLAAADPTSRATGVGLGIYEREIRFYTEIAPRIGGPLAPCHFARYDDASGWFTLLLEDVAPALPGDQIAGCSVEQARLAVRELARLHAPVFDDPVLASSEWLNRPSPIDQALATQLLLGFLERYGERVAADHRALGERFVRSLDGWLATRRPPLGLVHGDYRLDNLLFGEPGSPRELTVVDWQTVGWGAAMADIAYFLGGGLEPQPRRRYEGELLDLYLEELRARGIEHFSEEDCRTEYRRLAFGGVLMAIIAPMLVERTGRGDEMFMTMFERHSQHALDVDAERLLASAPPARAPLPAAADAHEQRHVPGPEQMWNESWYFDVIAADGEIGAYVRIGLCPNLGVCWYTALVCGPGRPTVAVVDFEAPLPEGDGLDVQTGAFTAAHRCLEPLRRFSVTLEGTGQECEDPASLLRDGGGGPPVEVAIELEWETAGAPYVYRMTTRYEIPCVVGGSIRLGDETFRLERAVGQRDHSWGVRDWWSMDWMWSAGALEDGTRLHAVELRLPGAPTLGVGYVQRPGEELLELERVTAGERLGPDGLITQADLRLDPPGIQIDVEPLAFAPLRLVSPDGRVSHFPRAMCRMRCSDGREGLGWVEWNLNQRAEGG